MINYHNMNSMDEASIKVIRGPFTPKDTKAAQLFREIMWEKDGEQFIYQVQHYLKNIPEISKIYKIHPFKLEDIPDLIDMYNVSSKRNKTITWVQILNDIFSTFTDDIKDAYYDEAITRDYEKKFKYRLAYLINKNCLTEEQLYTYYSLSNEPKKMDYLYNILDRNTYDKIMNIR